MAELPALRLANMAARRERILGAAATLLGEGGFTALTLRELAQKAGVTVPTIYNLIGTKEAVAAFVIEAALGRLEAALADAPACRGLARAEQAVAISFALFAEDQTGFAAVFRGLHDLQTTEEGRGLGGLFRRAGHVFEAALDEARADQILRGELHPLALAHHILHGLVESWKLWAVGSLPPEMARARAFYVIYAAFLADATEHAAPSLRASITPYQALLNF